MKRVAFVPWLILAIAGPLASPLQANGDLFFHEREAGPNDVLYLGRVVDVDGKPLVGARIRILIVPTQVNYFSTTDSNGRYRFGGVPKSANPRQVTVSAEKAGYRQVRALNVSRTARAGQPVEMLLTMERRK